jgi:ATP adenylyltransferase
VALERFSAAWREEYVTSVDAGSNASDEHGCVFCRLAEEPVDESTGVLVRSELNFVVLNAFPYGSGHLLVVPRRHVASLPDLTNAEYVDYFLMLRTAVVAIEKAYGPDGLNVGMNLGLAAGAGIPQHLHGHVLPRWSGDTNFMTTIGETRVLPESLASTWQKVHSALETDAEQLPS